MSRQLICPLAFPRSNNQMCLEENCSFWIEKGSYEKKTEGADKSLTSYNAVGTCAIKVIAERLG